MWLVTTYSGGKTENPLGAIGDASIIIPLLPLLLHTFDYCRYYKKKLCWVG